MATCAQSTEQEDGVTQQLPTKSTDAARALDGGGLPEPRVRRRLAWVPLSLVMLSLAGLAITPLLLQHYTRELRLSVRMVAEPSHLLVGELRVGLAHELSLAQRFALSRESGQWFAYHAAAASDDSILVKLDQTLHGMGAAARASLASLRQSVDHWRLISAVVERSDAADRLRDALQHGVDYEELLLATVRVDSAVSHEMQTRREAIESAESLEFTITLTFVAIGCIACFAVLILTLRDRHLRVVLRRRAEEEASLRRLAATLSGAFTIHEVGELTVGAALKSSRIGGAYLTRADGDDLLTVAGRGTLAPEPGSRIPMPSWLRDNNDKDQPRIFTTERPCGPIDSYQRGAAQRSLSVLVVPLCHKGEVIGALGIVSAGGRRQLGDSSIRFGRSLGDLAAVALHRAEALDQEQKARAEAERAVRTRDAVVSIVSHDLRNPLMAILGSAELLLEMVRDDPQGTLHSQLHMLKHAGETMTRLVRDLLDVTRLESGPLPVTKRRCNIVEVVNEVVGMFQAVGRTRRITVTCSAPKDVPPLLGDRDRLGQALSNLVGNAVKFTPDGSAVHVAVDVDSTVIRVSVHDTGAGIPEDQLPRLFDRFWQASREDSRGLGLGLTIVKAIIDAHGGTVTVESTLKKGSTFSLTFPRAEVDAAVRPTAGTTPPSMASRARPARDRAATSPLSLSELPLEPRSDP
jgi:signal transduction histidine kinase